MTLTRGAASRPLFEHRHFAWLAGFMAQFGTPTLAEALAAELSETNSRFDRARFLAAARGEPAGRDNGRRNRLPGGAP